MKHHDLRAPVSAGGFPAASPAGDPAGAPLSGAPVLHASAAAPPLVAGGQGRGAREVRGDARQALLAGGCVTLAFVLGWLLVEGTR